MTEILDMEERWAIDDEWYAERADGESQNEVAEPDA